MSDQEPDKSYDLGEIATRMNVAEWIAEERRRYAIIKWNEGENREVALAHMHEEPHGDWWGDYVRQYIRRAELQGLDSLQGRQQLGKALVTLTSMLETACLVYGPMPEPGHTSGEIVEWTH